jgi:hypothetical protein
MPTYAATNCLYLEETSFKTAGASLTMGLHPQMDKTQTTEWAYMHLPCCKYSSDRVSVPVDEMHLCYTTIHMLLYFHEAKQLCEKPEKKIKMYKE